MSRGQWQRVFKIWVSAWQARRIEDYQGDHKGPRNILGQEGMWLAGITG